MVKLTTKAPTKKIDPSKAKKTTVTAKAPAKARKAGVFALANTQQAAKTKDMADRIMTHLKIREVVDPGAPYHSTPLQVEICTDLNRVISADEFRKGVEILTASGKITVTKAPDGYGQLSLVGPH